MMKTEGQYGHGKRYQFSSSLRTEYRGCRPIAQGISSFSQTTTDADGNASSIDQVIKNVNLTSNPFEREFTDAPAVTASAAALAQMQGAGQVRDLHAAMSLGTAQSTRKNLISSVKFSSRPRRTCVSSYRKRNKNIGRNQCAMQTARGCR